MKKKGKIGYLDFSGNVDSTELASTEWLSDLEVVDGPFSFCIFIHFSVQRKVSETVVENLNLLEAA
jgi:hypothetical protein